jgi:hypothetical protein
MKSITDPNNTFTIRDFEEGLMLAGFVSPLSELEVNKRVELKILEKKISQKKSTIYFKRSVLAAEIVNQLHSENTFGRTKFQKIVYLCENASKMELESRYKKFAAGPFDNKFMHSITAEFKKQKWFDISIKVDGKFKKQVYTPAENVGNYKKYYLQYFSDTDAEIQTVISLLRHQKTHFVELVATVFACWFELNSKKIKFNRDNLFDIFYSWSKEKEKFTQEEIVDSVNWMKNEGVYPMN